MKLKQVDTVLKSCHVREHCFVAQTNKNILFKAELKMTFNILGSFLLTKKLFSAASRRNGGPARTRRMRRHRHLQRRRTLE